MKWARLGRIKLLAVFLLVASIVLPLIPLRVYAAIPTLTITSEVIPDVRSTSVISQTGNITATVGSSVTERGFEYDDDGTGAPYTYNTHEHGSWSTGSFSLAITSLSPDTTYYIRAYAVNTDGTGYSVETTFHTSPTDSYWVGNGGSWSDDDTHWATTTGGASGDGHLPGIDTNVHFDANSFSIASQTVTQDILTGAYCHDIDWTGVTNSPTFTHTSTYPMYISGSITWASSVTGTGQSFPFYMTSTGSETINWNGATSGSYAIRFSGVGGTWTLASATNIPNLSYMIYECTNGTFDTGGYGMNISSLGEDITGSEPTGYTVNLQTSIITLSGSLSFREIDNATINFGSSTISFVVGLYIGDVSCTTPNIVVGTSQLTGTNVSQMQFGASGVYFNDANLTLASGTVQQGGSATFSDLTLTGNGSRIEMGGNITVTNNLIAYGTDFTHRLLFYSVTLHTQRTITAGTVDMRYVDFRDIIGSGAGDWDLSGIIGGSGNMGNNTNITFTSPKTVYRVGLVGTQNWTANYWAGTSGGVASVGYQPLPQDMAIFDANTALAPGAVVTLDAWGTSGINSLAVNYIPTFSGAVIEFYGSLYIGGAVNFNVSIAYLYSTSSNTQINGIFTGSLTVDVYSGMVKLASDVDVSTTVTLLSGVLDLNDYDLTSATFVSSTTTFDRSLIMGSGIFTLDSTSAATKWNVAATKMQVYAETSTIVFTSTAANTGTFTGGGKTYYNLTIQGSGTYTFAFSDANTFNNIIVDRSQTAKTISGNFTETISGFSSPINGVTTVTITNTDFSMASGIVCTNYLVLSGSAAGGGATFYAGANSTNNGGNSGWSFTNCNSATCSTQDANPVTLTSARLNGTVVSMGSFSVVYGFFQYDQDGTFVNPTGTNEQTLAGTGTFYADVSGLDSETTYYYRAAIRYNINFYAYGATETFATFEPNPGFIPGYDPTTGISLLPGASGTSTGALEDTTTKNQTALPDNSTLTGLPGYPLIHAIAVAMSSSGYDVDNTEMMIWMGAGGILVLVVVIGLLILIPGHLLISGIGGLAAIGLNVSVGIFPWWTIAVAVIYLLGTLMQERANWTG